MEELFEDIEKLARAEKRVAMATLVATRGTSPKREGAKMWVGEEGRILGSVTIGGCVDARVIAESEKALSSFQPRLVEMKLADEDAWEIGFSCAGDLDVLIEPIDLTNPKGNLLDLVSNSARFSGPWQVRSAGYFSERQLFKTARARRRRALRNVGHSGTRS